MYGPLEIKALSATARFGDQVSQQKAGDNSSILQSTSHKQNLLLVSTA
jgi:hypothetical protein